MNDKRQKFLDLLFNRLTIPKVSHKGMGTNSACFFYFLFLFFVMPELQLIALLSLMGRVVCRYRILAEYCTEYSSYRSTVYVQLSSLSIVYCRRVQTEYNHTVPLRMNMT